MQKQDTPTSTAKKVRNILDATHEQDFLRSTTKRSKLNPLKKLYSYLFIPEYENFPESVKRLFIENRDIKKPFSKKANSMQEQVGETSKNPVIYFENRTFKSDVYWGQINPLTSDLEGFGKYLYPCGGIETGLEISYLDHPEELPKVKQYSYYEGRFKNSRFHGPGRLFEPNKIIAGYWKQGVVEGKAVLKNLTHNWTYEGRLKDLQPHDQNGLITFTDSHYKGGFKKGVKEGQGRFEWEDGRVYQGEWSKDTMNGKGTFTWPDGREYRGMFKNGVKEGFGVFKFVNGAAYEGKFSMGRMHGKGKMVNIDGSVEHGLWNHGMRRRGFNAKNSMIYLSDDYTKFMVGFSVTDFKSHPKNLLSSSMIVESKTTKIGDRKGSNGLTGRETAGRTSRYDKNEKENLCILNKTVSVMRRPRMKLLHRLGVEDITLGLDWESEIPEEESDWEFILAEESKKKD